jgi:hypothetical protein
MRFSRKRYAYLMKVLTMEWGHRDNLYPDFFPSGTDDRNWQFEETAELLESPDHAHTSLPKSRIPIPYYFSKI